MYNDERDEIEYLIQSHEQRYIIELDDEEAFHLIIDDELDDVDDDEIDEDDIEIDDHDIEHDEDEHENLDVYDEHEDNE